MYYLCSLSKQGWWTGYNYTSDFTSAKEFTYGEALDVCRMHKDGRNGLTLFPVSVNTIKELTT